MSEPDKDDDQHPALNRVLEHFPRDAPLELQVLKGHLVIEVQLRDLFEMQLAHPNALKGGEAPKFDCHQIICLTHAISQASNHEQWLWPALKTLNSIRNSLAHKLDQKDLESKVASLVKRVIHDVPAHKAMFEKAPDGANEFYAVILILSGVLAKLQDVVA